MFRKGSAVQSVTTQGRVRVSAAEGVRAPVLAHLGLALTSRWMFAHELAEGSVRPCWSSGSCPRWTYGRSFPPAD